MANDLQTVPEKGLQPVTPMELLAELARTQTDPTVIAAVAKSIAEAQKTMVEAERWRDESERLRQRFEWEREERQNRQDFDDALSRCQKAIGQVAPDKWNKGTKSWYIRYDTLDAVTRPVYTAEGFSLSFGERDCPTPGKTRFVAFLSRNGITREYIKDLTPSTKGPSGGDVMTPIHADGSADSYAKRYLQMDIWNISKLIGETDNDGNQFPPMDEDDLNRCLADLNKATDIKVAQDCWKRGTAVARDAKDDDATIRILRAYEAAKKRINAEAAR